MEDSLVYNVLDNIRRSILLANRSSYFHRPVDGFALEPSSIYVVNCNSLAVVCLWDPQAGDGTANHHVPDPERAGRVQHVLRRNGQADPAAKAHQQFAISFVKMSSLFLSLQTTLRFMLCFPLSVSLFLRLCTFVDLATVVVEPSAVRRRQNDSVVD